MKVLYFDPILGASGDMILAALLDLGIPRKYVAEKLKFIPHTALKVRRVQTHGVSAKKVDFTIRCKIKEKSFIPLLKKSGLKKPIILSSIKIIENIFKAEKKVHQMKSSRLHLHELADADTLLDITGALIAIDYLKVDKVFTKPLKAGTGFIKTVEGNMPAFNFATSQLLKGFPIDFLPVSAELTTPTAAAIISTIARPAKHLLLSKLKGIGLGTGSMRLKEYPNLLRVFLGELDNTLVNTCTVLETNIDDMNPQYYEMLFEKLYDAGALEVYITQTIMKKSRPGVQVTVLCNKNEYDIAQIIFKETTTLGLRMYTTRRLILPRQTVRFKTPYGLLRVKITGTAKKRFSIEYEDMKTLAQKHKLALPEMHRKLVKYVETKI